MTPRFFLHLLGVLGVLLTGVSAHAVGPRRAARPVFRPAAEPGDMIQVLSVNNNWVEPDPVGGMLYVSLGSSAPNGNSVLRLDPATMGSSAPLFVGSEPGMGAISDDGQYLYIFLNGSAQIRRVHLPTFTPGLQFPLGNDSLGAWRAEDLEVVPGQPNVLLATMYHPGYSPRSIGTALYDNGVRRPNMSGWGNRHSCHPSGQKAYIFHNETTAAGTWQVSLGPTGVAPAGHNSNLLNGFGIDGKLYNGLIYANNGAVYDPEANLLLGSYTGGSGMPVVDTALNRVYFLTGWGSETQIKVFDRSTFLQVGTMPIPGVEGGAGGLVSCADGGFAFRTATQVFVVHTRFRPSRPQAPGNLTATSRPGGKVALGWTDNSPSEDGFRIERSVQGGGFAEVAIAAANATTFLDAGVAPSTTYAYRVQAFNVAGQSGYSNTASAITAPAPPGAPGGLTATALSYAQINLAWQDASSVEESFEIERKSGNGAFVPLAVLGPNQGSYFDSDVSEQTAYTYRVRAVNPGGPSAYSNEASATTTAAPTAAPSNLSAGAVSSSEIRLAWRDNSGNETLFKIERKIGGGEFTQIGTAPARSGSGGTATYADTAGLAPGTTYTYQVRALGPLGHSAYSNTTSANTVPVAPGAPSGLTAAVTSPTAISLSWVDNSANETGFKIERKVGTGNFSFIGQAAADTANFPDAGLSSDTLYTYRVRATNSAGDSAHSAEASASTPPAAPSGLSAAAFGPGQIKLTWTDKSNTETGFKIERKVGGNFAALTTVGAGTATYTDFGLAPNSTFVYRVRAVNGGGDSAFTGESSALTLPAAPTMLEVVALSATQLELRWTDNNPSPPAVKVERSINGGGSFAAAGTAAAGTTLFRDNGLNAATLYFYRVRATNASGDSDYSSGAGVSTLPISPAAPSGLTVVAQSSAAVLLTWQDNSNNESGFEVSRLAPTGGGYQLVSRTGNNVTTFTDAGVNGGTLYSYRVRAVNAGGASSYTVAVSATTPADLPTPPSSLAATALSGTQIRLTWTDLTAVETGYRVERKPMAGVYAVVTTTAADAVEYLDGGLAEGASYTYRVTAIAGSGASPASGEVTATTLLGAPTALVATAAANKVNLAWQDGSTHEAGFQIERKTAGGEFSPLASVGASITAYADTAVTINTTYTYRVKATGSGGSAYSNESSAVPLNVTPLAKLVVAPAKINFGTLRLGTNKLKTIKLTNQGKEPLTATVGVVGAPFTVVSGGGSATLAPKQSRVVTLRYAPATTGAAAATLRITSTVPSKPQVDVTLSGKGK